MRFLLFYGSIDALNHFTDKVEEQLKNLGHETYIVDLLHFDQDRLLKWVSARVHSAIIFDGIGIFAKELYDSLNIPVVNILVDHPMTFGHCMIAPPKRYIQFSPDEDHVTFAKRFYGIENAFFLPHMGTLLNRKNNVNKDISLLFGGWYKPYNESYKEIKENYPDDIKLLFLEVISLLLEHPEIPIEMAFEYCIKELGWEISDGEFASVLHRAKPVDEFVRMYYRSRVLDTIIKSGMSITIVGEGWDKFAATSMKNVISLPRVNFKEMYGYMWRSEIVLNIMPWFKAGTHERIFNTLLCGACPFTDGTSFLLKHFPENEKCAYYSLNKLDDIPMRLFNLKNNEELQKKIIVNGRLEVINNYTNVNLVETILNKLSECYGVE